MSKIILFRIYNEGLVRALWSDGLEISELDALIKYVQEIKSQKIAMMPKKEGS